MIVIIRCVKAILYLLWEFYYSELTVYSVVLPFAIKTLAPRAFPAVGDGDDTSRDYYSRRSSRARVQPPPHRQILPREGGEDIFALPVRAELGQRTLADLWSRVSLSLSLPLASSWSRRLDPRSLNLFSSSRAAVAVVIYSRSSGRERAAAAAGSSDE